MARNNDFIKSLENDKDYNDYLDSRWGTINSMRGKITFNKAKLGATKAVLIGTAIGTAYFASNGIATIFRSSYTLFDTISYGASAFLCGWLSKYSYRLNKKFKAKEMVKDKENVKVKK